MEKLYSRGDIVFLKNQQIFVLGKGYTQDLRVNGHPYIIMKDVYELGGKVPCLLLSSKQANDKRKKEFVIKKIALKGKASKFGYVDIGRIYYITFDKRYLTEGYIKNSVMDEIIKSLNEVKKSRKKVEKKQKES